MFRIDRQEEFGKLAYPHQLFIIEQLCEYIKCEQLNFKSKHFDLDHNNTFEKFHNFLDRYDVNGFELNDANASEYERCKAEGHIYDKYLDLFYEVYNKPLTLEQMFGSTISGNKFKK